MFNAPQIHNESTVPLATAAFALRPAGFGKTQTNEWQAGLDQLAQGDVTLQRFASNHVDIPLPVMLGMTLIKPVQRVHYHLGERLESGWLARQIRKGAPVSLGCAPVHPVTTQDQP